MGKGPPDQGRSKQTLIYSKNPGRLDIIRSNGLQYPNLNCPIPLPPTKINLFLSPFPVTISATPAHIIHPLPPSQSPPFSVILCRFFRVNCVAVGEHNSRRYSFGGLLVNPSVLLCFIFSPLASSEASELDSIWQSFIAVIASTTTSTKFPSLRYAYTTYLY